VKLIGGRYRKELAQLVAEKTLLALRTLEGHYTEQSCESGRVETTEGNRQRRQAGDLQDSRQPSKQKKSARQMAKPHKVLAFGTSRRRISAIDDQRKAAHCGGSALSGVGCEDRHVGSSTPFPDGSGSAQQSINTSAVLAPAFGSTGFQHPFSSAVLQTLLVSTFLSVPHSSFTIALRDGTFASQRSAERLNLAVAATVPPCREVHVHIAC
jgi:hypothetical protein